ncbi:hypothetical protein TVAG_154520 [Trichomonas vaginalis G3]|uniref:Uncharacterized protein n=1 Tax=Trichomonas vaginalis (strain ATCC PRA-98 / G3) TaxID=412133 RepID=A2E458_TRIV3|nr:hypothetical protein TVAGG3_0703100 [Trichomonas vaginalis G3]EAY12601.1 hypothetical protein TVAG_154520 [Trichomonas vaginalis G3]KAI5509370.1 hypothetical protein TVAGG3_0703100 [Trichomonas vaginalis G3]|eukprot:XP_001324824.1 hypothetical protein [Trichomonas vaginalis G3]
MSYLAQDGNPLTDSEKSMRELSQNSITEYLTTNKPISSIITEQSSVLCDMIANYSEFIHNYKDILYYNHSFAKTQMDSFFAKFDEIDNLITKLKAKEITSNELIQYYRDNVTEITRVSSHFNAENLAEYFFGKNEVINIMKTSQSIDEKSLKQYLDKRKECKQVIRTLINQRQISDVDKLINNLGQMHDIAVVFLQSTENYSDEIKEKIELIFNDMIRKTIQVRAFFILEAFSVELANEIIGSPAESIVKIKQQVEIPETILAIFQNAHTNEEVQTISEEFRKNSKYTMTYRILDIYFEMLRLANFSNRIEILLTNRITSSEMREYYSNLSSFIVSYFDPKNSTVNSAQIRQNQAQIKSLIKSTDTINFGSHTTKAFAHRDLIHACLEKIDLLYESLDHAFDFISQLNKLLTEPLKTTLPIVMNPIITSLAHANFGQLNMENIDKNTSDLLNTILTRLPSEGVVDEVGDGYHITEKDLIVPDLYKEFTFLLEEMRKPDFTKIFSNNFYFNLNAILRSPSSLSVFRKCLHECSRIVLSCEFFGENQPRKIYESLNMISNAYNWISVLDFCGVIDYTAAMHLMYIRTYSHICFKEDLMSNAKLFDKIEKFQKVTEKISEFHQFFDNEEFKSILQLSFDNTLKIIDYLFNLKNKSDIKDFSTILDWILCSNLGQVKCIDISSIYLKDFDNLKSSIERMNKRSEEEERMAKSVKYLRNFFDFDLEKNKVTLDKTLENLNKFLKPLKHELGLIQTDFEEIKIEEFDSFRNSFVFKSEQIFDDMNVQIRQILGNVKENGQDLNKLFDQLVRGGFSLDVLHNICIEVCNLSIDHPDVDFGQIKKDISNSILCFLFLGLINLISTNINTLERKSSTLKAFNYKQFMDFFCSEMLYMNTCGVFGDNNVVAHEIISIKRFLNDEINFNMNDEDFDKVKVSFLNIIDILNRTDPSFFIKKSKTILSTAVSLVLEEDEKNGELIQKFDELANPETFDKEKFINLSNLLKEKLKSQNVYPFYVQIISTLNTFMIYQNISSDVNSFLSTFTLSFNFVPLSSPFVIIPDYLVLSRSVRPPTLPMQSAIEYSNDDYINFCISSQKSVVEKILDENYEISQSDISAPKELLSLDIQNDIAQALIEEKSLQNLSQNNLSNDEKRDIPNSTSLHELQQLQNSVLQQERRQTNLRKQLRENITKWHQDLQQLSKKYEETVDEVSELRSDCMEFCGLEARQKVVSERVERKKNLLQELKKELESLRVGEEISLHLGQEFRGRQESIEEMSKKYTISTENLREEMTRHLNSLSPYEIPEEKKKNEENFVQETNDSSQTTVIPSMKQSRLPPIIAKYCHTPGLFPSSTREAVEAHVDELLRVGDSREMVKKFSEVNTNNIADKMKRNTRIATANIIEKQADLSRRIAILNEILNEGDN